MKNCLLENEFKFGQIDYNFNYDSIINKIGKPDSIQVDEALNSEILYYQDLNIGMTNNHIYYMWIKSSELSTSSGIKLGLDKNTINEKLQNNYSGKLEIDSEAKNVQIVNCKTEYYLVMDFESNILVKLEMGIDLP